MRQPPHAKATVDRVVGHNAMYSLRMIIEDPSLRAQFAEP
jgi:hypothetical protein